jgi:hypothetical protein
MLNFQPLFGKILGAFVTKKAPIFTSSIYALSNGAGSDNRVGILFYDNNDFHNCFRENCINW